MGISDRIEAFILELMKQERDEQLRIRRNELAQIFGCVPSQINYVISTRFSPERGYIVQSRRGGGGFVEIRRAPQNTAAEYIGASITAHAAQDMISAIAAAGRADDTAARLMTAAVTAGSLEAHDEIRADILRRMINALTEGYK